MIMAVTQTSPHGDLRGRASRELLKQGPLSYPSDVATFTDRASDAVEIITPG
jgi:hypothetical protein